MKELPEQTETADLAYIRQSIQNIQMPVSSFTDNIMARIGEKKTKKNKSRLMKKALIASSAAAVLGVGIIGSAYLSPAMAESLKNIPGVNSVFKLAGDLGLRTADEQGLTQAVNKGDTHDGITLSVAEVVNDGARLAIALHRDAPGLTSYLSRSYVKAEGKVETEPEGTKGVLGRIDLFMNGKQLTHRSDVSFGRQIHLGWRGIDKDNAILSFQDLSNQGLGEAVFPDEFTLTLKVMLDGVNDPFMIDVPVKKSTKDNLVLSPNVTKEFDHIRLHVKKVELTPVTTRFAIEVDGTSKEIPDKYRADRGIVEPIPEFPEAKQKPTLVLGINCDIFDDQGNKLNRVDFFGNDEKQAGYTYMDVMYEPLKTIPKTLTIKPYLYVLQDQSKGSGQFLLDSKGEPVVEYIKELEMTIPISK